jgi:hypothetical protein
MKDSTMRFLSDKKSDPLVLFWSCRKMLLPLYLRRRISLIIHHHPPPPPPSFSATPRCI